MPHHTSHIISPTFLSPQFISQLRSLLAYVEDHETAQSAVRNLNNVDCGGRPLRIDLADSDPFLEGKTTVRGELVDAPSKRHRPDGPDRDRDHRYGPGTKSGPGGDWLSQVPRGKPLQPGLTSMDAISQVVADIRQGQMMDILGTMKSFILDQPDRARTLLTAHPQLAYALFQALLVHQIVDPQILHRMIAATAHNAAASAPPPPVHQPPLLHTHHPVPGVPAPPPALPPHLLSQHSQSPYPTPSNPTTGMYSTPPPPMAYPPPASAQAGYYPPSHVAAAPPPAPPAAPNVPPADRPSTIPEDQRAMLMQMLALSNEQINALPPEQRQAIQQLRSQFMALGNNLGS